MHMNPTHLFQGIKRADYCFVHRIWRVNRVLPQLLLLYMGNSMFPSSMG
jgi:hypothetical protein